MWSLQTNRSCPSFLSRYNPFDRLFLGHTRRHCPSLNMWVCCWRNPSLRYSINSIDREISFLSYFSIKQKSGQKERKSIIRSVWIRRCFSIVWLVMSEIRYASPNLCTLPFFPVKWWWIDVENECDDRRDEGQIIKSENQIAKWMIFNSSTT